MTSREPRPAEMLGTLLGNYRILGKLGQGGMGVVFVGRHETLGHRVAVKVLHSGLSRDAEMVRRFFNEAQAATAIRNLGITQVFDFGMAPDGRAYFVMELLEGQSLAARLKERRIDHEECCRIGRQAANVLQAAHSAGITHRDLKPDNLFLIPDAEVSGGERVKVLDFGIAKVLDFGADESVSDSTAVRTRTGLMMGTPHYMSPEQCRGAGAVDSRSDIYSLGCILFKMMCGRPPFIGEGAGEILGAHQYLEAPHPQTFAPDMPPELASLIARMLAKHPDSRPQAMNMVCQALDDVLRSLGAAPPTSTMVGLARPRTSTQQVPVPGPRASAQMPAARPRPSAQLRAVAPRASAELPAVTPRVSAEAPTEPPPAPAARLTPSTMPAVVPTFAPPAEPPRTPPGGSAIAPTRSRRRSIRRLPLLLGSVFVGGAAGALVLVLSAGGSRPREVQLAENKVTLPPTHGDPFTAVDAGAPGATAAPPAMTPRDPDPPADAPAASTEADSDDTPVADAPVAGTAPRTGPPALPGRPVISGREVELECLRYQESESWSMLLACSDRLRSLNAPLASTLRTRALQESQAAPRIASVDAALREKNLKRARAELDQVWTGSSAYPRVKARYDAAEEAALTDLVASLKRAKKSDCKEYNRVLAQEGAAQPPRVSTEAQRQVPCVAEESPPGCDLPALDAKGKEQFLAGQLVAAIATYEAAFACKPDPRFLRRAFVAACNLKVRDLKKVKAIWRRLSPDAQEATVDECTRNGITQAQLDAP